MRTMFMLAAASLAVAAPAQADTICEWMDFAEKITRAAAPMGDISPVPEHSRATTHAALAMFEAVNAIDRRYGSYIGMSAASPSASQEAAAVTAVYRTLLHHFPDKKKGINYRIYRRIPRN
jgi:hypothetical protein